MGQDSLNFVISDRAFEPGHVVFSVGDDLGQFGVRSTLDVRGAQVSHLQALSHRSAATVWPVAGFALRFIHTGAGCTVLSGGGADSRHDHNKNDKNSGECPNIGMWLPGL